MIEQFVIKASENNKGQRLDRFLISELSVFKPEISRNRLQILIESGQVSNSNNQTKLTSCDYRIKGEEQVLVVIPIALESAIIAKNIPFEVVFEDENMLVINKPAGLTTHPGNGNTQNTLVNALLFYCGKTLSGINGVMRPGIVHRLDKDTSGLMVVAKNDLAHRELAKQIEQRILKRNYLAFCYGTPKPLSGVIEKNISRSKINRLKMTTSKTGGRVAITNYEVQKLYFDGLVSLIKCQLDTGRTHQIRVHLSSISHPIIGDATYCSGKRSLKGVSDKAIEAINNFSRQALHSYKIGFSHPVSQKEMIFEIDLPKDMADLKSIF
jgi:23S rRNA pseudouridine1911/1915/1917 synthase